MERMTVFNLSKEDCRKLIPRFKSISGSYELKGKSLDKMLWNPEEIHYLLENIKYRNCKVGDNLVVFNMFHQRNILSFIRVSINDETGVEFDHFKTLKVPILIEIQNILREWRKQEN
jgi:hypothetical protein